MIKYGPWSVNNDSQQGHNTLKYEKLFKHSHELIYCQKINSDNDAMSTAKNEVCLNCNLLD